MTNLGSIHQSEACAVITRQGSVCGTPSVQKDPNFGPICALHLYHRRRSSQAREHLQLRVDREDLEALDRLAQAYNLTRSDAIRRTLKRLPFPRALTDAESYRELRRVGVNVNQIARCLNRGDDPDFEVIHQRLDDLAFVLEDLALKITGVIDDGVVTS